MKTQKLNNYVADTLTEEEVMEILQKVGDQLKARRNKRTTIERFAYETRLSRSQVCKYEAGGDMLLSSFLKLLHGLDTSGEAFFRALKK